MAALALLSGALLALSRAPQTAPAGAAPPVLTEVAPGTPGTPLPTRTPLPTATPTVSPTPTYPFEGTYTPPAQPPPLPVPPPAPPIGIGDDAVETILLLGSDSPDNYYRRTDVMILVAIHKDSGTVALWHIPRALWVYVPNHTMDLINVAYAIGAAGDYPGGGLGILQDTFRYNFGIELDHYARVNFTGFMKLIEALGGLEISVDCAIRDWRLKEPELDPGVEENWEQYTLPVGRHRLSPYMALWYVRSRKTTSDLDRGRRQMDVLRAMWQQIRQMGLLAQIERLWPQVSSIVDTDMTLTDVLGLVPLATTLDLAQVARYGGTLDVHYTRTFTPDNGREVLVPNRDALLPMLRDFLTPPTANRLGRTRVAVEVADASWYGIGYARVAADRLAWEGFAARPLDTLAEIRRERTVIYDYTGATKGSPLPDLQRVLRVGDAQVIRQPDPNRTVDFRVEIGMAYRACVYGGAEDELLAALATPAADALTGDQLRTSACWLRFRAEVNVRAGPGTAYAILDLATPNDHFPVTGRTADGAWWRVDDDGEAGWVSATITTAQTLGDCAGVPVVGAP